MNRNSRSFFEACRFALGVAMIAMCAKGVSAGVVYEGTARMTGTTTGDIHTGWMCVPALNCTPGLAVPAGSPMTILAHFYLTDADLIAGGTVLQPFLRGLHMIATFGAYSVETPFAPPSTQHTMTTIVDDVMDRFSFGMSAGLGERIDIFSVSIAGDGPGSLLSFVPGTESSFSLADLTSLSAHVSRNSGTSGFSPVIDTFNFAMRVTEVEAPPPPAPSIDEPSMLAQLSLATFLFGLVIRWRSRKTLRVA